MIKPQNLKGLIFIVDAAALSTSSESDGLTEAAQFLHDILLALQKRHTSAKSSRGPPEMPVLIVANKLDLFTALPAKLVKKNLETEISKLRNTKSRGLVDSGIGMDDHTLDDQEMLGGNGEGKFDFGLMEEYNVQIEVLGGSVFGTNGPDTRDWWQWISRYL
ncbi:MAG: hypothetical protein M1828_006229 [Chrysothrix sp. TS-e1954]|nr:MAG: hypothetical protein M1828_006229 [Chrysothrix sp. TS-e1954]